MPAMRLQRARLATRQPPRRQPQPRAARGEVATHEHALAAAHQRDAAEAVGLQCLDFDGVRVRHRDSVVSARRGRRSGHQREDLVQARVRIVFLQQRLALPVGQRQQFDQAPADPGRVVQPRRRRMRMLAADLLEDVLAAPARARRVRDAVRRRDPARASRRRRRSGRCRAPACAARGSGGDRARAASAGRRRRCRNPRSRASVPNAAVAATAPASSPSRIRQTPKPLPLRPHSRTRSR